MDPDTIEVSRKEAPARDGGGRSGRSRGPAGGDTRAIRPATKVTDPAALEAEIAQLHTLGLADLRERWRALYGRPAPNFFRRKLLVRAIAYETQVQVYGGLSRQTQQRLREIAAAIREGREDAAVSGPRIRPGTRLYRAWQGKTHCVIVAADGFEWGGTRFGSLSGIAKAITGTQWNGYAFFGVKRRPSRNKNAAGPRRRPGGPSNPVSAVRPPEAITVGEAPHG